MLKNINQCDVYVGIWCVYMLQEVLYSPGIINQSLQLIMLIWGMIALFKYMTKSAELSSILRVTILLIVMYTIYGGIHMLTQSKYYYLQISLNSLVPIFLFYYFTEKGMLTSHRLRCYLPILIVICVFLFYKIESSMLLATNKDEITNNIGYNFVALIPFLFFYYKKPILQYLLMGIILLFVFMGMKRGAILIGVVALILFLYANVKYTSRWKKSLIMLLTIIIVFGISKYIEYMMNNSAYFISRMEDTIDGNTSGRDAIYENLWNTLLLESSPFYFYLGRGAESTLNVVGNFAHQDWLETFCNNGLIGVIILFAFFYTFGKNVWMSKSFFPRMMFYSFASLFIISFSKTLFSMSIQNLDMSITMLLGYFAYWMSYETDNFEICNYEEDE